MTAISVTRAPLARMAVNASWPGVSKKVILLAFCAPFTLCSTWYAPMCCVIPPASPEATSVFLMASRMDVFPWSTCPITTTTGGLGSSFSGSSLRSASRFLLITSSAVRTSCSLLTSTPSSEATMAAVSKSIVWLIVAITPFFISTDMTAGTCTPAFSANSFTVTAGGTMTTPAFFFI